MCARKQPAVALSPKARQDYDDILLYGVQNWGEEQSRRYQARLDRALDLLGDFPEMGPRRDEYFSGCRIQPIERHVIFYRILDDEIEIVRILHERADASQRLRR